jgi:hypothetical protein
MEMRLVTMYFIKVFFNPPHPPPIVNSHHHHFLPADILDFANDLERQMCENSQDSTLPNSANETNDRVEDEEVSIANEDTRASPAHTSVVTSTFTPLPPLLDQRQSVAPVVTIDPTCHSSNDNNNELADTQLLVDDILQSWLDMADSAVPARGDVRENRGDADEVDYQQESKCGDDEIGDDGFGPGIFFFVTPPHSPPIFNSCSLSAEWICEICNFPNDLESRVCASCSRNTNTANPPRQYLHSYADEQENSPSYAASIDDDEFVEQLVQTWMAEQPSQVSPFFAETSTGVEVCQEECTVASACLSSGTGKS